MARKFMYEIPPTSGRKKNSFAPIPTKANLNYVGLSNDNPNNYIGIPGATLEDYNYINNVLYSKNDNYPITQYTRGYAQGNQPIDPNNFERVMVHDYPNGARGYDIVNPSGRTEYYPTTSNKYLAVGDNGIGNYVDAPNIDWSQYNQRINNDGTVTIRPNTRKPYIYGGRLKARYGLPTIPPYRTYEVNDNTRVARRPEPGMTYIPDTYANHSGYRVPVYTSGIRYPNSNYPAKVQYNPAFNDYVEYGSDGRGYNFITREELYKRMQQNNRRGPAHVIRRIPTRR